jgi:hypothetical protein
MPWGYAVPAGLIGMQFIAAAIVLHDRIGDVLNAIWSVL